MSRRFWNESSNHVETSHGCTRIDTHHGTASMQYSLDIKPGRSNYLGFRCAAFVQMDKRKRRLKTVYQAQKWLCLSTKYALHRLHLVETEHIVHRKHPHFNDHYFSFSTSA